MKKKNRSFERGFKFIYKAFLGLVYGRNGWYSYFAMTGWGAYAQTAKPTKDRTMFCLQGRTRNAHYIANANL